MGGFERLKRCFRPPKDPGLQSTNSPSIGFKSGLVAGKGLKRDKSSNSLHPATSSLKACTLTAFNTIKEISDVFPPVKSAVSCVLSIHNLSRKVESNKKACLDLASRVEDNLFMLDVAVRNSTQISPDLLSCIPDYADTLTDIQAFMQRLERRVYLARLAQHIEDAEMISDFQKRLSAAFQSFELFYIITIKMEVSTIKKQVEALTVTVDRNHEVCVITYPYKLVRMDLEGNHGSDPPERGSDYACYNRFILTPPVLGKLTVPHSEAKSTMMHRTPIGSIT